MRTQYNENIKMIHSDNALELAFSNIIRDNGIMHQFSCAYTPQQNSILERKHQHLLKVARALMFQSHMPLSYWSDCILTAVFLINRTPSLLLNKISPYEKLTSKKPDYNFLRSFGCLCYVSTLDKDMNKFTHRAKSCVFLGYPSGYKGYKVLDLETRSVSVSRNVIFHETDFPFKKITSDSNTDHIFTKSILPLLIPTVIDSFVPVHSSSSSESTSHSSCSSLSMGDTVP